MGNAHRHMALDVSTEESLLEPVYVGTSFVD